MSNLNSILKSEGFLVNEGNLPPMYPHQKQAVDATDISDSALIIRGAGSGKTRIGIEIVKKNLKANGYVAWLCPAALISQSMGDFDEAKIPNYRFTSQDKKLEKGKVAFISYSLLKRNLDFLTSFKWDLVVSDEFHRTRNKGTVINEGTWHLRKKSEKFYALTATPFNNFNKEFFEILSIVVGIDVVKYLERSISFKGKKNKLLFSVHKFFMNSLFGKKVENKITTKLTLNKKNINSLLDAFIDYASPESYLRSIKRPKAKSQVKKIELLPQELKKYRAILKDRKIRHKEIALRVLLLGEGSSKIVEATKQTKNILNNKERKIIIFSNFVASGLGTLSKSLQKAGVKHELYAGSTSKDKRSEIKKEFLSGNLNVLLISPSGFEGLNLKGTTDCIVLDPHYNPAKTEQIISRGLRAGSDVEEVNIFHYCSVSRKLRFPTIDEKIMRVSGKKDEINKAMEDLVKQVKEKE